MTIMAGRATNWRASGACLHADPDLFFPISSAGRALSHSPGQSDLRQLPRHP